METTVSRGIVRAFYEKLDSMIELDAAIVGAGPSGLVAAARLAKMNKKVALFESKLAPGGGMWGGAMMFSNIVVQSEAARILDEFKISYKQGENGTVIADSVEATSSLIYHAASAGAKIFNCMSVEDVMLDEKSERVNGIVVNWGPVTRAQMHVDPLVFRAKAVMDATGHPAALVSIAAKKNNIRLNTPSGSIMGERSLCALEGERLTVAETKEVFPGLFVSGMAANGVSGAFRMGPIFGGMLLSGEKAARIIAEALS